MYSGGEFLNVVYEINVVYGMEKFDWQGNGHLPRLYKYS